MKYEEALEKWGEKKLREKYSDEITNIRDVEVTFDFERGYECCGGSNPDCYCSFAESPRANVFIRGVADNFKDGKMKKANIFSEISLFDFDFATMIKELFEVKKD